FAPLLPDFQEMAVQDERHFEVKVNVGISYIKGTAEMKMELAEASRPQRARYKGQGKVAGGNISLTAGFDLVAAGGGTKVAWEAMARDGSAKGWHGRRITDSCADAASSSTTSGCTICCI